MKAYEVVYTGNNVSGVEIVICENEDRIQYELSQRKNIVIESYRQIPFEQAKLADLSVSSFMNLLDQNRYQIVRGIRGY